jgi:hypothetical protein
MRWPFAPVSKKIIVQALTNVLMLVVTYVIAHQGLNVSAATAGEIASFVALLAGLGAGWLAKEIPGLSDQPPGPE